MAAKTSSFLRATAADPLGDVEGFVVDSNDVYFTNIADSKNFSFFVHTNHNIRYDSMTALASNLANDSFKQNGFLILESLYEQSDCQNLIAEFDSLKLSYLDFYKCASNPIVSKFLQDCNLHNTLWEIFDQTAYSLHHFSATIHSGISPSLAWHHDKVPIYNKSRYDKGDLMVHALFYPNGINPGLSELLLVPKSHHWRIDRYQLSAVPLESINCVKISKLSPGSVIFINSSLLHARRSIPNVDPGDQKRYLLDFSFCSALSYWEPYIESDLDFKSIFKILVDSSCYDLKTFARSNYLSVTPFTPHPLITKVPWPMAKLIYRFLSFISRKILDPPSRFQKLVVF